MDMKETIYKAFIKVIMVFPLALTLVLDAIIIGFIIYKLFQIPGNKKIVRKYTIQPQKKNTVMAVLLFILTVALNVWLIV